MGAPTSSSLRNGRPRCPHVAGRPARGSASATVFLGLGGVPPRRRDRDRRHPDAGNVFVKRGRALLASCRCRPCGVVPVWPCFAVCPAAASRCFASAPRRTDGRSRRFRGSPLTVCRRQSISVVFSCNFEALRSSSGSGPDPTKSRSLSATLRADRDRGPGDVKQPGPKVGLALLARGSLGLQDHPPQLPLRFRGWAIAAAPLAPSARQLRIGRSTRDRREAVRRGTSWVDFLSCPPVRERDQGHDHRRAMMTPVWGHAAHESGAAQHTGGAGPRSGGAGSEAGLRERLPRAGFFGI